MKTAVIVNADQTGARINPNIYGHFAEHLGHCVEEGIWVGDHAEIENTDGLRRDVIEALCRIKPAVLRWPGGCFADDYHWEDGVGPRRQRPKRVNVHWGQVTETNEFGTHEFIEFCRLVGAEPYICGNLGSGTVREMRDWLEYLNFDGDSTQADRRRANGHPAPFAVQYFGVGNESWGCGGSMTPEYCAHEVRRYATFLHAFGDTPLCRIACGPCGDDPAWTRKFLAILSGCLGGCRPALHVIQGLSLHYYCGTAGTATEYTEAQWYELLEKAVRIEPMICRHRAIMDGFDPERRVGLIVDEWGTWHPVMPGTHPKILRQQNTVRDALVAALTLDIFNRHADKVVMSNIAQTVNVLQAMVLTDGPKMLCTPTYHVYEMYVPHQGANSVPFRIQTDTLEFRVSGNERSMALPQVAGSCSRKGDVLTISLVNTHASEAAETHLDIRGAQAAPETWRVLAAPDVHAHNTFAEPDRVSAATQELGAGPIALAPASVNVLTYRVESPNQ